MCTVTYIPTPEGFYFTSSRDEQASRETMPPQKHAIDGNDIVFPKDELAGGTWIASSLEGRTVCLLNGAYERHIRKNKYAKSRGVILLESFNFETAEAFANTVDLEDIEPFTLITLDYSTGKLNDFTEFRWDGEKKHFKRLSKSAPQIWSSATLYLPPAQKAREQLFDKWMNDHKKNVDRGIKNFHNQKHGLKKEEDIVMSGIGDLMTLSISQVYLGKGETSFNYFDMITDKEYSTNLIKKETINA